MASERLAGPSSEMPDFSFPVALPTSDTEWAEEQLLVEASGSLTGHFYPPPGVESPSAQEAQLPSCHSLVV